MAETLSTLRFACRAKKVQNRYVATSDPRDALIASLQREVLAMKKLLQQTLGMCAFLNLIMNDHEFFHQQSIVYSHISWSSTFFTRTVKLN